MAVAAGTHPLDPLTADEIRAAVAAAQAHEALADKGPLRFNFVTLNEPPKPALRAFAEGGARPPREAEVLLLTPQSSAVYRLVVALPDGGVAEFAKLEGVQPLASPDECFLAEDIVKKDPKVQALMKERYGVEDMGRLVCDPWSVHHCGDTALTEWRGDGAPGRLIQAFLYLRDDADDNHYAHPLDMVPVVDLYKEVVFSIFKQEAVPAVPKESVNYHRAKLASNSYLQTAFRENLKALDILQPEGPSFAVAGNVVTWQGWRLRVGFNYREGLVLHDVTHGGRPVLDRASLVEMAVPYGDTNAPFQRKCAFDVGDYGLGYCANSLALGCDCLGSIYYFDAELVDSKGEPYTLEHAICMHEEDAGILWKHMEYRNGHSEVRRARKLVLSFIATVVNYEYLFYWYLHQDGMIEYEIKLSGELSTNLLSESEQASGMPQYGTLVAPGVNAQYHQHCFCARLDMAVDGPRNTVVEVDVEPLPPGPANPYGNGFAPRKTLLRTEKQAQRVADPSKSRAWAITNPSVINPISKQPVAYKLMPFTKGSAGPTLLTGPDSAVTKKAVFATKNLWVTPYDAAERWPAGVFPLQSDGGEGLPAWTAGDRGVEDADVVVWHCFAVTHVPRVEDFPVMPCEFTGFTLKPDGFFQGNPAIDLPPSCVGKSVKSCAPK